MKRAGIGIPDPTQTILANFETSENCCEVLTASLLNGEALDLREHATQVREGRKAGRGRRVDMEERELWYLKATEGKKAKRNLEWACKGGGWLTVLPRPQDGNDLSREEFRDDLRWRLDLSLQNTPLACDGCSNPFTMEHA